MLESQALEEVCASEEAGITSLGSTPRQFDALSSAISVEQTHVVRHRPRECGVTAGVSEKQLHSGIKR